MGDVVAVVFAGQVTADFPVQNGHILGEHVTDAGQQERVGGRGIDADVDDDMAGNGAVVDDFPVSVEQRGHNGGVTVHGGSSADDAVRDAEAVADHAAGIIDGTGTDSQNIVRIQGKGVDIVGIGINSGGNQDFSDVLGIRESG